MLIFRISKVSTDFGFRLTGCHDGMKDRIYTVRDCGFLQKEIDIYRMISYNNHVGEVLLARVFICVDEKSGR